MATFPANCQTWGSAERTVRSFNQWCTWAVAEHRRREVRAITVVLLVVNMVAAACAIVPAVNDVVTGLVWAAVAAGVAVLVLRWVVRRVQWWFEDRHNARIAVQRRAAHSAPTVGARSTERIRRCTLVAPSWPARILSSGS